MESWTHPHSGLNRLGLSFRRYDLMEFLYQKSERVYSTSVHEGDYLRVAGYSGVGTPISLVAALMANSLCQWAGEEL
jgi:hypothetical protein